MPLLVGWGDDGCPACARSAAAAEAFARARPVATRRSVAARPDPVRGARRRHRLDLCRGVGRRQPVALRGRRLRRRGPPGHGVARDARARARRCAGHATRRSAWSARATSMSRPWSRRSTGCARRWSARSTGSRAGQVVAIVIGSDDGRARRGRARTGTAWSSSPGAARASRAATTWSSSPSPKRASPSDRPSSEARSPPRRHPGHHEVPSDDRRPRDRTRLPQPASRAPLQAHLAPDDRPLRRRRDARHVRHRRGRRRPRLPDVRHPLDRRRRDVDGAGARRPRPARPADDAVGPEQPACPMDRSSRWAG